MKKIKEWLKQQTEFYIAFFAAVVWFIFWILSLKIGTESYPVGMFQKIAFGILGMSIIQGVTFFSLKKSNPYYADLLDPNTQGGINNISEWERIKVGLFWVAYYGLGAVLLAALY